MLGEIRMADPVALKKSTIATWKVISASDLLKSDYLKGILDHLWMQSTNEDNSEGMKDDYYRQYLFVKSIIGMPRKVGKAIDELMPLDKNGNAYEWTSGEMFVKALGWFVTKCFQNELRNDTTEAQNIDRVINLFKGDTRTKSGVATRVATRDSKCVIASKKLLQFLMSVKDSPGLYTGGQCDLLEPCSAYAVPNKEGLGCVTFMSSGWSVVFTSDDFMRWMMTTKRTYMV
jgi:hypothetical protein